MWFKNLQIYRLPAPWAMTAAQLAGFLAPQAFTPCTSIQLQSQGWIPPRPNGGLVHVVNKQMLLSIATEKKLLPSSVINQVAKARAAEQEEQQGFKPGRKQMKELKEQVADELLPRAFSIQSTTRVWIDPVNGWLVIDTSSASRAEDVIRFLLKAVDRFPLDTLRVAQSPVSAMTEYLLADEAPGGFTVDQDTELRATGEGKATVRYVRHTLEAADVRRHIEGGKQCTRLAMTWADRVSFVLTESLTVKRVVVLDVLKENNEGTSQNDDERFDTDFALMAGELAKMLADLVKALGGEMNEQTDWAQQAAKGSGVQEAVANLNRMAAVGGYAVNVTDGAGNVLVSFGDSDQDPLYDQAVQVVRAQNRAAVSLVQRHLRIGYNRASRLIEKMERQGVVSSMESNGNRTVLQAAT